MGNAGGAFDTRLGALDRSLREGDLPAASRNHAELGAFVGALSPRERVLLEQRGDMESWGRERRLSLKMRWEALRAHGGSWAGWDEVSRGSAPPSKDVLWHGARDLVYLEPPGPHRMALWRFCTGCDAAGAGAFAARIEALQGEDDDCDQVEQMWLDAARTPYLTAEKQATLVRILRVHCARQRDAGGCGMMQYVQGMHMLASCPLWAGFSEAESLDVAEHALGVLCAGYYTDSAFSAFRRDTCVVEALVKERLPRVLEALRSVGMPLQVIAFDPLLCLFTHHAPGAVAMRLWDILLVEGDIAIFALLLVLLERVLPEAAAGVEHQERAEQDLASGKLSQRFAALSACDVEDILPSVRALLGSSGPTEGFRGHVAELRKKAEDGTLGGEEGDSEGWLDAGGVLAHMRSWWGGA